MATVEDIKRRVKALLAKKHGGTEAEISSALALAKKLMGEWRLTEADLGGNQPANIKEAQLKPRAKPPQWEMNIGLICSALFQVKAFTRQDFDGKTILCFVGYPADLELALETFTELKAQIIPLGHQHQTKTRCTFTDRSVFGQALVMRLLQKVEDSAQAAKAEDDERCRALVVSRMGEVEAHVKSKLSFAKPRKPSVASWVKDQMRAQSSHWKAGRAAAEKVQFGLGKKKLEAPHGS